VHKHDPALAPVRLNMEIEMGSVWYGMVVRCIWEWDMDRTLEFRDGLSVILGERKGNHSKGARQHLRKIITYILRIMLFK